jgi:hypothetical protein
MVTIVKVFVLWLISVLFFAPLLFADTNNQAIDYIKKTPYTHGGISATYVEVSAAYAIASYMGVEFVGWETQPDPKNPVATLVTIRFRTSGINTTVVTRNRKVAQQAVPSLPITWRVNDLLGVKITPYNSYAVEAIRTYQGVVGAIHSLAE